MKINQKEESYTRIPGYAIYNSKKLKIMQKFSVDAMVK